MFSPNQIKIQSMPMKTRCSKPSTYFSLKRTRIPKFILDSALRNAAAFGESIDEDFQAFLEEELDSSDGSFPTNNI